MSDLIAFVFRVQRTAQKKDTSSRDECNKLTINGADGDKYDHEKDEPITQYTWDYIRKVTTLAVTFSAGLNVCNVTQRDNKPSIISKEFDEGAHCFNIDTLHDEETWQS